MEWLVDSSDEILVIRADEVGPSEQPGDVTPLKTLKYRQIRSESEALSDAWFRIQKDVNGAMRLQFRNSSDSPPWRNASCRGDRSSEWLVFIRNSGQQRSVVKGINLTKPTETSWTSAITSDGRILKSKDQILKHVRNRIRLGRKLPKGCQREHIDHWMSAATHRPGSLGPRMWWENVRKESGFLSAERIAEVRGGFALPVQIEYWDQPADGDLDEDLHLTFLIVPADGNSRQRLMEAIRNADFPDFHRLVALLNFPGAETDQILESVAGRRAGEYRVASRFIEYFRYVKDQESPFDERLLGKWRLAGINETVHLDFKEDLSCTIDVQLTGATGNNRQNASIDGKGRWAVRDGKLWIARTHIRKDGKWRTGRRQFFPAKKIITLSQHAVNLEGGPPMRREE